mmetsp:Transcript_2510/g.5763  ORF Transcript_2510/g.5763 Transcript_2510/m.5763 type:complete len:82 (+) Transcript_2510:1376-1621(+)
MRGYDGPTTSLPLSARMDDAPDNLVLGCTRWECHTNFTKIIETQTLRSACDALSSAMRIILLNEVLRPSEVTEATAILSCY